MLEFNDVLVEGAEKTVSMMAQERQLTCITGGSSKVRTQLLLAMMGLAKIKSGFVCIDGEPLEVSNLKTFRQMMSYAPSQLVADGEINVYEPPAQAPYPTGRSARCAICRLPAPTGIQRVAGHRQQRRPYHS